jgi:ABC-type transporter Mla MlaB component
MGTASGVGWVSPDYLAADGVALLEKRCQNLPMPWVLDWTPLKQIDTEACAELRQLFRRWAGQQVDMRWLAGDQFLQLLKDLTPVAVRDVDPALWMLRLEALRLVNRPDQFDETAIDYCVTYEVSPPSWERAKCRVRLSGSAQSTTAPPTSSHTEARTSFMESLINDAPTLTSNAQLELSGQLSGDIGEVLRLMTAELGAATVVTITCAKLIRLDFMAAGDLLNWVLSRRSENRTVIFTEAHRLVALFLGAMGINEHARVKVRQV